MYVVNVSTNSLDNNSTSPNADQWWRIEYNELHFDTEIGKVTNAKFDFFAWLLLSGQGCSAVVYKGKYRGQTVAIKCLINRFTIEYQFLLDLTHTGPMTRSLRRNLRSSGTAK